MADGSGSAESPGPAAPRRAPLDHAAALFKIPLSELESEIEGLRPPGSIEEAADWGRKTAVHGLAYSSAMIFSKTATAPAERIRLLLQTQPASHIPRAHRLQGLYHACLRIPRTQGYMSFWRGNLANVLRVVPHTLLRFSANDSYKEMLCGPGMANSRDSLQKRITAAGLAGLSGTAVTYPLDVVRTRLSIDTRPKGVPPQYASLRQCVNHIVKTEGWKCLYRGVTLKLASSIPYASTFTAYMSSRRYERQAQRLAAASPGGQIQLGVWSSLFGRRRVDSLCAGAIASAFAGAIVYPIDTIRRRLMVDGAPGHRRAYYEAYESGARGGGGSSGVGSMGLSGASAAGSRRFTSAGSVSVGGVSAEAGAAGLPAVQVSVRMYSEEGLIAFYRGLFPFMLRSVPQAALMFLTYDGVKDFLGQ